MPEINWYPSPNFSPGRCKIPGQLEQVLAIMNHKTAGRYPGCRDWLCRPAAEGGPKASAHYVVSRAGDIDQLVALCDTAWHGGIINRPNWALLDQIGYNPNRWTIGIEHEDYDGDGEPGLTEPQYQATLWLHRKLIADFHIPVNDEYIVGHNRVDSVNRPNCPGPDFPWERLFRDLKGGSGDMKIDIPDVKVVLDGVERTDCVLLTVEGRPTTYIPAIALRESGHEVTWDQTLETVTIKTK